MARSGFKGARGTSTDVEYIDDVDEAVAFLTRHRVEVPDSFRGVYLVSRGDTVIEYKPEGFHDAELRRIHDRVTGRRGNPVRRGATVRAPRRPGPLDNPGLHAAIERAARRAAMTGVQPSSGEVADWIRQYPKTWRQMVARLAR